MTTENQPRYEFKQLIELQSNLVNLFDIEGVMLYANQAYLNTFGFKEEDILGKKIFSLLPKQNANNLKKIIEEIQIQPSPFTHEHRTILNTPEGERWFHWQHTAVLNENGKTDFIIGIGKDVTTFVEAEEELKRNEERYRRIFETSPLGILTSNIKGTITSCNPAFASMSGYTVEDFVGTHFTKLPTLHTQKLELYWDLFQNTLSGKNIDNFTLTWKHRNGNIRTGKANTSIIRKEGKIHEIQIIVEDITEKKQAEQAIAESDERFRQLSNLATEGILIHENGICTDCNLAFSKITGYSQEELIGMDLISTLITPEFHEITINSIQQNNLEPYEIEFFHKKGHVVPIRLHSRPIEWQGVKSRIVNVQDITQQKKAENKILMLNKELEERVNLRTTQLQEANKELEAFSYSVSHDLQAPVRAIRGFSDIINEEYEDQIPEEVKEYFERIQASTKKMNQLINGLLDLSRLGRKNLHVETIKFDAMANKIFQELAASEQGRTIKFTANTNQTILADKEMLTILLRNLIGNAVKYTRREPNPEIIFSVQTNNNQPVFYISDNGVGFDMEYAEKLFQPFQRLHTGELFEGTGVGLSLVKRIIQHHQGNVWVESEEGKGTTFYFTIGELSIT